MLRVLFLGTGGSFPTPVRNTSAILINRDGELILFDCGEGAQRQMMRAKSGMGSLGSVFLTHLHADHFLGLPGVIQTLSFQKRTEPLAIFGPKGTKELMVHIMALGNFKSRFEVQIEEVSSGDVIKRSGYEIKVIRTEHSIRSVGYVLEEDMRLGRFDRERAIELGVPPGPMFSKLHHGGSVTIEGREIKSEEVVGPPRPGRKIVYTGDTRPCRAVIEAAKDADLLIHDSTMADELADWAAEYRHSTSREAAQVAKEAGVLRLILTHISPRYSDGTRRLLDDARKVFSNATVAEDLMEIEVQYRDKK
ncbi:MAG: ribonuclease Z [Candidatus Syntropharchaeales archaeon]|nr:ribonuclease Z [Candidatus Syntrophoarchaeum sp.]